MRFLTGSKADASGIPVPRVCPLLLKPDEVLKIKN